MKFITGFLTGAVVATSFIVGPYNVASSVAAFIDFVRGLAS
ncbi:hypothetical protein LCGC14_0378100 [marine sediment metagenome]|uniref:Uncharacterized protein n=1 Tax=marine sediment metagenome TaxID=412755 RepID=A0A0F9TLA4_9ZZZZ